MGTQRRGIGRRVLLAAVVAVTGALAAAPVARADVNIPPVPVGVIQVGGGSGGGSGSGWSLVLTATPVARVNSTVTLTAVANQSASGTGWWIEIDDMTTGYLVTDCADGTVCTGTDFQTTAGTHTYVAYVASLSVYAPPPDIQATSNSASVVWTDGGLGAVPGDYSDSCSTPTLTAVDGYVVGNTYVRLLLEQDGAQNLVCFRIQGSGVEQGGDVVVSGASAGVPSVDGNQTACKAAPGNTVVVDGTFVNQPTRLDVTTSSTAVWVCLLFGSVAERIVMPVSTGGGTSAAVNLDSPGSVGPPPPPLLGPAGYPSSTCQSGLGTMLLDATVGGTQAFVFLRSTPSGVEVCARVQGGVVSAGGMLTVDAGVTPVVTTSGNTSACSFVIASLTVPVQALLATSPIANPATVCVGAGGTAIAITVGVSGSTGVPSVTWTPDPGTL
jgi:hypothetical protein